MKNTFEFENLKTVNMAEIEMRARALRAEAVQDGFATFKAALASVFFNLFGKSARA